MHLVDRLDAQATDELLEYAQWLATEEDEPLERCAGRSGSPRWPASLG
jgi:hypothetical protein